MRNVEVNGAPVRYVNAGLARRTGAVTASALACSPGFCSVRRSLPTPSLPTVIPPVPAVPVAGTTAAVISGEATSAGATSNSCLIVRSR
jgi:hypothetical protein